MCLLCGGACHNPPPSFPPSLLFPCTHRVKSLDVVAQQTDGRLQFLQRVGGLHRRGGDRDEFACVVLYVNVVEQEVSVCLITPSL